MLSEQQLKRKKSCEHNREIVELVDQTAQKITIKQNATVSLLHQTKQKEKLLPESRVPLPRDLRPHLSSLLFPAISTVGGSFRSTWSFFSKLKRYFCPTRIVALGSEFCRRFWEAQAQLIFPHGSSQIVMRRSTPTLLVKKKVADDSKMLEYVSEGTEGRWGIAHVCGTVSIHLVADASDGAAQHSQHISSRQRGGNSAKTLFICSFI